MPGGSFYETLAAAGGDGTRREEAVTTNPSTEFLEELGRHGHVTLFEKIDGRLRLDLRDGREIDSWMVVIHQGDVEVSRGRQDSDCVIHAERAFFDRVVTGEANALSALLRGLIRIEGNLQLALSLGRALPGPPHSRWRGSRRAPGSARAADAARTWTLDRAQQNAHHGVQIGKDRGL